jgi:putative membrane protein
MAFYVGFKNNQAYERLWEARIIWGGIVNSRRMWGSNIKAFIINPGTVNNGVELFEIKKAMIYRHLAWLYKLRSQLLESSALEHLSLGGHFGRDARDKMQKAGLDLYGLDIMDTQIQKYLPDSEYKRLSSFKNAATQLIGK